MIVINPAKDETGKRYNRLTVIERVESATKSARWLCRCDCGNMTVVTGANLRYGAVKSCGCIRFGNTKKKNYTEPRGRLYLVWNGMKTRCYNPNFPQYKDYGGRGIKVCPEWHDYANFLAWAKDSGYDENAPRGACTLDRIDNNSDYCPENCHWVSMKAQAKHRRKRAST